jgi:phage FluMu gp28-like protein
LKDEDKDILCYRVKFASGYQVTALSSRPSNLRGKQGRVVIDEAAFHEDFPELMKAALALLMWGGRVHVISTHDGADNPFNKLIQDIRAGRKRYSLHRITLDDAIGDGLVERICLKLNRKWSLEFEANWKAELLQNYGEEADEELFVIPSMNNRIYFPSSLIETRMEEGKVLRFKLPDNFLYIGEVAQKRI